VWIVGGGPTLHEGSAYSRVAHDPKMQPSQNRTCTPLARRRGLCPARSVRSRRRHYTFGIGRPLDSLANTVRTRPHYAYWPVRMAERLNVGVPNRVFVRTRAETCTNSQVGAGQVYHEGPFRGTPLRAGTPGAYVPRGARRAHHLGRLHKG